MCVFMCVYVWEGGEYINDVTAEHVLAEHDNVFAVTKTELSQGVHRVAEGQQ